MTIYDIGGEIFRAIQTTPLVSMRPMCCEWESLFKSCEPLTYVRSGKEELQSRLVQHIEWLNCGVNDPSTKMQGLIAEDLSACIREADVSFL
jgi:hypothetical protein